MPSRRSDSHPALPARARRAAAHRHQRTSGDAAIRVCYGLLKTLARRTFGGRQGGDLEVRMAVERRQYLLACDAGGSNHCNWNHHRCNFLLAPRPFEIHVSRHTPHERTGATYPRPYHMEHSGLRYSNWLRVLQIRGGSHSSTKANSSSPMPLRRWSPPSNNLRLLGSRARS